MTLPELIEEEERLRGEIRKEELAIRKLAESASRPLAGGNSVQGPIGGGAAGRSQDREHENTDAALALLRQKLDKLREVVAEIRLARMALKLARKR